MRYIRTYYYYYHLISLLFSTAKTITRYWIGLNDKKTEMLYEWSDGTPVTYTNWYAHEPNDANGEDCVEMYIDIVRNTIYITFHQ